MIMSLQVIQGIPRLMNLSQETTGSSIYLLISRSMYLDMNNTRSPKQTDKEYKTCYIQIRFPDTHEILFV